MTPELAATIAEGRAWATEQRAEVNGQLDDYEAALDALECAADDPDALDQALAAALRVAGVPQLRVVPYSQPDGGEPR